MIHLRHVWRVAKTTEQLSAFEQMHKAAYGERLVERSGDSGERRVHLTNLAAHDYVKPVIVTYGCARCLAQKVARV